MNNELLAKIWDDRFMQIVVVWPLVWKHYPGGDWFVHACFNDTLALYESTGKAG